MGLVASVNLDKIFLLDYQTLDKRDSDNLDNPRIILKNHINPFLFPGRESGHQKKHNLRILLLLRFDLSSIPFGSRNMKSPFFPINQFSV